MSSPQPTPGSEILLTVRATVANDGAYIVRDDAGDIVFSPMPGQSFEVSVAPDFRIPGTSAAQNLEQSYRLDAAHTLTVAARRLAGVADRIRGEAGRLGDLETPLRGAFPAAGAVRNALNEFRNASDALMHFDSALDSAMLADQARASRPTEKVRGGSVLQGGGESDRS